MRCPAGTDTRGCCKQFPDSHYCDELQPDDSCRYANDGECDEPKYCITNTDASDCDESSVMARNFGQ
jgi:hypothetical protein